MRLFLKYMKSMFSSSNEVSWGRITATLVLCYVVAVQVVLIYLGYIDTPKKLAWVAIDPFWRDVILGTFGISKGGETAQVFAEKKKVIAKAEVAQPKYDDSKP